MIVSLLYILGTYLPQLNNGNLSVNDSCGGWCQLIHIKNELRQKDAEIISLFNALLKPPPHTHNQTASSKLKHLNAIILFI